MRTPSAESPTSRPVLLVALVAVAIVLVTVWFREGEGGPIHRLRDGVHVVAAPVAGVGEFATRPVRAVGRWLGDLGVSRADIDRLERQNAELRRRNAALEEARQENLRLREMLSFVQDKDIETLGARVIGRPMNAWEGVITINRGSRDGVKKGMPVTSGSGLLGQTVEVGPASARVRLITDQGSRVAALIQRMRTEGIVRGSVDGALTLDYVSVETTVRAGDVIVTSGMGGVYPKGLLVGEVAEVRSDPGALYQAIRLSPAASLSDLEEVLVIVGNPPAPEIGGSE